MFSEVLNYVWAESDDKMVSNFIILSCYHCTVPADGSSSLYDHPKSVYLVILFIIDSFAILFKLDLRYNKLG